MEGTKKLAISQIQKKQKMTLEFDHKRKEKKEERKNITEVGLTLKRREKKK